MKFLIGTKLNMTQVFREDGTVVPVTRVVAGPCVVTKVSKIDGKKYVEVGFGTAKKLNQPMAGHLAGLSMMREMRSYTSSQDLKRGDVISITSFAPGDRVSVSGVSKGKGFQGVVKRHHFAGGPASHGHKDNLRMPGSIGATDSQRVYKGTRMGGHMGSDAVTVHNLEVVAIDTEKNELLLKGAVPGARGGVIEIHVAEGEMAVIVAEEKNEVTPDATETTATASAQDAPEEQSAPAPATEDASSSTPAEAEAKE